MAEWHQVQVLGTFHVVALCRFGTLILSYNGASSVPVYSVRPVVKKGW